MHGVYGRQNPHTTPTCLGAGSVLVPLSLLTEVLSSLLAVRARQENGAGKWDIWGSRYPR